MTVDGHDYVVRAASTDTFGRVLVSARSNHLVVDGPVANGCPGEAVTPAELFLGAVASCAVELVAVIAKDRGVDVGPVSARIGGTVDRAHAIRSDVTIFSSVTLELGLPGVADDDAAELVKTFKGR